MGPILRRFQLFTLIFVFGILGLSASTRIIKGTITKEGKPVSGALVTVHKSKSSYFTSFDGKYEVKAESRSKWIKYSFSGLEYKKELDPNSGDYVDFQLPVKISGPDSANPASR
jgi:hypothetical protein